MPTYEYKCINCSHIFEMFQSMKDEPIKICPKCKGEVKRLIGAGAGPIFKGSGFYHTDYKNSTKSTETKVTEKAKPASNSNSSQKSDSK
ncbi:MAG: FmdB family zinc ribbon protein [Ignavibacteriaceae bacterium]